MHIDTRAEVAPPTSSAQAGQTDLTAPYRTPVPFASDPVPRDGHVSRVPHAQPENPDELSRQTNTAGSVRYEDASLEFKPEEGQLRTALRVLAILYFLAAVVYAALGLQPAVQGQPQQLLLSAALGTKTSLLAMLCLFGAANVRRARPPIIAMTFAHGVTILLTVLFILKANDVAMPVGPISGPFGSMIRMSALGLLALSSFLDLIAMVLSNGLLLRAERARYGFLGYLNPLQYQTLSALADVLILDRQFGTAKPVRPDQVAYNVDKLLRLYKGKHVAVLRGAVYLLEFAPFLRFKSNFAYMNSADRLDYLKYWVDELIESEAGPNGKPGKTLKARWRNLPPVAFINRMLRAALVAARQLVYIGYYSDPAVQSFIGFEPFAQRTAFPNSELRRVQPSHLDVTLPSDLHGPFATGEVVVIGSGAGASILARELVLQGFDVLMIERGMHVQPETLNENEADRIAHLYADGIMQYSRNLALQVVQGSCVGGSTVVNNGICFDPPQAIVGHLWDEYGAHIDLARLQSSTHEVRKLLKVTAQPETYLGIQILNPSAKAFTSGLQKEALAPQVVEANLQDCLGCGYCNIGCPYGRKLSMLNHVLPEAQQLQRTYPDRTYGQLRILSECEAVRIFTTRQADGSHTATGVECRTGTGTVIEVTGKAYIVAAGAIASSTLLMNSGLGGQAAGTRLSFNAAGVMTGRFPEVVNAYAGLQMSHYYLAGIADANGMREAYALETWFNPPMTQALAMPGWFETHFRHMQNYDHMMALGVLVGTGSASRVLPPSYGSWASTLKQLVTHQTDPRFDPDPFRIGDVLFNKAIGSSIVFKPSEDDIDHMVDGMIHAGRVMLQAGAEYVMPSTVAYHTFATVDELKKLRDIVRAAPELQALQLGSAHPQGGNPMSDNPQLGVVDSRFKVHGTSNVFVCDASVFPSSVGLNPQLTVMSLAHYAAQPIGYILRHDLGL